MNTSHLHNDTEYSLTLTVDRRRDLETELDAAVDEAIQEALRNPGRGILVTRHSPRTFIIELSANVAHGTIIERDLRP